MQITNAKYQKGPMPTDNTVVGVSANINGKPSFVLIDTSNRIYLEIKRQADAGTITIAAAD
jgi:hypothetical protein|tara:strand:+ start:332 stop:514 length:183 start_codon:yes stop_codon:yes gene_type:complete